MVCPHTHTYAHTHLGSVLQTSLHTLLHPTSALRPCQQLFTVVLESGWFKRETKKQRNTQTNNARKKEKGGCSQKPNCHSKQRYTLQIQTSRSNNNNFKTTTTLEWQCVAPIAHCTHNCKTTTAVEWQCVAPNAHCNHNFRTTTLACPCCVAPNAHTH